MPKSDAERNGTSVSGDCTVLRADGSPLSPTEEREVRALLAAHAAEPLGMPRGR